MSDRARAMIWGYYDPKRWGAPMILAIALSDEADDRGGGIFQSIGELAKKTRQADRAVRRQMKRMEHSGLLQCVERSTGGHGNFNQYRLHLAHLLADSNPDRGSVTTLTEGQAGNGATLTQGQASGRAPIDVNKDFFSDEASAVRVGDQAEDLRLAEWIYGRLVAMNPKHRSPSWAAWCKDLRLLRERDGRTRREIAELFAWANADTFWQSNILSPGKLRTQWDQLVLKRRSNGGHGAVARPVDKSCARQINGTRCSKPGAIGNPDGTWRCENCAEVEERARAT
jgi:hypothetical protein